MRGEFVFRGSKVELIVVHIAATLETIPAFRSFATKPSRQVRRNV